MDETLGHRHHHPTVTPLQQLAAWRLAISQFPSKLPNRFVCTASIKHTVSLSHSLTASPPLPLFLLKADKKTPLDSAFSGL